MTRHSSYELSPCVKMIKNLENLLAATHQNNSKKLAGISAAEIKNRFMDAIENFMMQFARHRSLVFFIDDLQWADSASLQLLDQLMEDTEHLLLLGAYRDNEVSPAHPLMLTVEGLAKAGGSDQLKVTSGTWAI